MYGLLEGQDQIQGGLWKVYRIKESREHWNYDSNRNQTVNVSLLKNISSDD